jgi:hypothetical protein
MKHLKSINLFESNGFKKVSEYNIDQLINDIFREQILDKYHTSQFEIEDYKRKDFLTFCETIAKYTFVDERGDNPGHRRYKTDLTLNDVIYKVDTGIACGIKIVRNPIGTISEWDSWEGGYIEGFIRMDADKKYKEWFVWQYIEMKYLNEILTTFKDDLIYIK